MCVHMHTCITHNHTYIHKYYISSYPGRPRLSHSPIYIRVHVHHDVASHTHTHHVSSYPGRPRLSHSPTYLRVHVHHDVQMRVHMHTCITYTHTHILHLIISWKAEALAFTHIHRCACTSSCCITHTTIHTYHISSHPGRPRLSHSPIYIRVRVHHDVHMHVHTHTCITYNAKRAEAAAALTATCVECKREKQRKEYSEWEWHRKRPKAVCKDCAKSMFCRGCQTRRPLTHFSQRQKRDHRHDGLAMCKTCK